MTAKKIIKHLTELQKIFFITIIIFLKKLKGRVAFGLAQSCVCPFIGMPVNTRVNNYA